MDIEAAVEEFGGDRGFILGLTGEFISTARKQLQDIEQGLENGNFDAAKSNAHSIKGGSANLTANDLSQAAMMLEQAAKGSDREQSYEAFGKLKSELERLSAFFITIQQ